MIDTDRFWSRVKNLIKIRAQTQATAAKACGIPYSTLRGWMHKKIFPPLEDAYNLSRYLGVSIEFFMNGKGPGKTAQINEKNLLSIKGTESKKSPSCKILP